MRNTKFGQVLARVMVSLFGWRSQPRERDPLNHPSVKEFGSRKEFRQSIDWGRVRKPRRTYSNKMRRCAGMTRPHCTNKWRKAEIASK